MKDKNRPLQSNKTIQAAMAKYPKARRIAVENVSYWYRGTWEDSMNLQADARIYGWNNDTIKAILFVHSAMWNDPANKYCYSHDHA